MSRWHQALHIVWVTLDESRIPVGKWGQRQQLVQPAAGGRLLTARLGAGGLLLLHSYQLILVSRDMHQLRHWLVSYKIYF